MYVPYCLEPLHPCLLVHAHARSPLPFPAAVDETVLLDQDSFGKKEKLQMSQIKDGIFFVMYR